MGVFDNISNNKSPSPAQPQGGGAFDSIVTPGKVPAAQTTPTKSTFDAVVPKAVPPVSSPYFYGKNLDGSTIGRADELDVSGKPFLAYRNPGDTATTTDKTRMATTFDPRAPQKLELKSFLTARMPDGAATQLKKQMGGSYSDELDHSIALELAGSNDKSNLKIQKGRIDGPARASDTIENKLARDVVSGNKSLFDAQTELAQQKGLPTPWVGQTNHPANGPITNIGKDVSMKTESSTPAVAEKPAPMGDNPGGLFTEPTGKFAEKTYNQFIYTLPENLPFVGPIVKFLRTPAGEDAAQKLTPSDFGPGSVEAAKGIARQAISPVITAAGIPKQVMGGDGSISLNIPGLGKVDNVQSRVIDRVVNGGESPVKVALTEGTGEVFNTLFLLGMFKSLTSPRASVVTTAPAPEGLTVAEAPKPFREYQPPQFTQPLTNDFVEKMSQQGVDLGPKYDPSLPTFFRMRGTANGNVVGEVVQIKPSYASQVMDFFKSSDTPNPNTPVVWKPTMDQPEANNFTKDSQLKITVYHGADESTAAKIKDTGFQPSKDFPGNGAVNFSSTEDGAANYSKLNGKGEVLPAKIDAQNVKTFTTTEEYENAIEAQPGVTAGEKEQSLLKNYDAVVIKDGLAKGSDEILVPDPKKAVVISSANPLSNVPENEIIPLFAKTVNQKDMESATPVQQQANMGNQDLPALRQQKAALQAQIKTAPAPEQPALVAKINELTKQIGAASNTEQSAIARQALIEERTKNQGNAYSPASVKIDNLFKKTGGQKQIKVGNKIFELGNFGKASFARKGEIKGDRFPASELADTLKHTVKTTYAHNDPTSYRYDNIVHIAEMPDGENRVVYTRVNAAGHNEIINWHKISNPQYISDLQSFGTPGEIRTPTAQIRTLGFDPNNGDKRTLPHQTNKGKKNLHKETVANKYHSFGSGPKISKAEIQALIKKMLPGVDVKVVFDKDLLSNTGALGRYKTYQDLFSGEIKQVIKLYESGGKSAVRVAMHEAYHALENAMPASLRAQLDKETLAEMSAKDKQYYANQGYASEKEQASEFRADEWGKTQADQAGYKSRIQKILDKVNAFIQNIIDFGKRIFNKINSIPNKQGGFARIPFTSEEEEFAPRNQKITDIEANKINKENPDIVYTTENKYPKFSSVEDAQKFIADAKDTVFNSKGLGDVPFYINEITDAHLFSKDRSPEEYLRRARLFSSGLEIAENAPLASLEKRNDSITYYEFLGKNESEFPNKLIKAVISEQDGKVLFTVQTIRVQDQLKTSGKAPTSITQSLNERKAAAGLSDVQKPSNNLEKNNLTLPETEKPVKSDTEIKVDYREAEKGNKELNKELRKEAPGPTFEHDKAITELEQQKAALGEKLLNDPARNLLKYKGANGLGEVTGSGGVWQSMGDQKAMDLGFSSSEDARRAFDKFMQERARFKDISQQLSEARGKRANLVKEDKDAKSLNYLLNKNASKTEVDIARQDRVFALQKAEKETAARLQQEEQERTTLQEKINRVHLEYSGHRGLLKKVMAAFSPSKHLDKVSKPVIEKWFQKTIDAKQAGLEAFDWATEQGPQNFQEIVDFQAGKQTSYIKQWFDDAGTDFKRRGLSFGWRDNYMPDIWKESTKRQAEARRQYMKSKGMTDEEISSYIKGEPLPEDKAFRLKLRPNFSKERFWPDYVTGMAHGLTPKFQMPADLIGYYKEAGERAVANIELIRELKSQARLLPSDEAPDSWEPVTLRFSKEGLYAPPPLAELLNGKFRDEGNLKIYQAVPKYIAGASRFLQDLVLSGGVPGTNINAFSAAQAYRLATTAIGDVASLKFKSTLTNLKIGFAFIRSNSNALSASWFKEKSGTLAMMARNGIDLTDRIGGRGYETLRQGIANALRTEPGVKGKTKGIFHVSKLLFEKAVSEKTFKSLMPQIKVLVFEGAYKEALRRGLEPELAEQFAAGVTKAAEGITPETGRGNTTKDTLSSVLFAPPYREGLVNIYNNAAKGFSVDFNDPTYSRNRSFIIGLAVVYLLYNIINKKLNGNYLWDNPPGRELAIRIPRANGDVFYIELGPGLLTVPRNLFTGTAALVKGDTDTAKQKYGTVFSMPLQITTQVWANKDYFGNPIWSKTDTSGTILKKIGAYVGLETSHPYVSQIYKYAVGKQPLYWSLINMAEIPVKLTSLAKEQKSKYYDKLQEKQLEQARAKEKIMPIYQKNQDLKNSGQGDKATEIYNNLNKADKAVYDLIKKDEKLKDTNRRKAVMQGVYDNLQKMKDEGRTDEANKIYAGLSPEDQHAYDLIKKAAAKSAKL